MEVCLDCWASCLIAVVVVVVEPRTRRVPMRSAFSWRGWGRSVFLIWVPGSADTPDHYGISFFFTGIPWMNWLAGWLPTVHQFMCSCLCEIVTPPLFPLHSCPTCCWTPPARTQRPACTPCSSERASRSTPNQSRKSSKATSHRHRIAARLHISDFYALVSSAT